MGGELKQSLAYFSTVIVGQLVSFLLLPFITRYLTPAHYGTYSLVLTTASLIGVFGSTWLRNVAFRLYFDFRRDGRAYSFFWSVAGYQCLIVGACFGVWLVGDLLVGTQTLGPGLIAAAGLSMLTGDFYALTANTLRAEQQTGKFAAGEVTNSLVRLGATAAGLLLGFRSPEALFLATAVGSGAAGIFAAASLRRCIGAEAVALRREMFTTPTRLGLAALPFSLGSWVMALSDRLILGLFAGPAVVGVYSAGYSLADRLISGLSGAVFMMGWPQILGAWSAGGKEAAVKSIRNAVRVYLWLTVGPLVFVIRFRGELVALLTGPSYAAAVQIVVPVAVSAWLSGLTSYLSRPLELQKRYPAMSTVTMIAAGVNFGLNMLLVRSYGAVGAALSTLIAYAAFTVLVIALTDRSFLRFPTIDLFGALSVAAAAWLLAGAAQWRWWGEAALFVAVYAAPALCIVLWPQGLANRFRLYEYIRGRVRS